MRKKMLIAALVVVVVLLVAGLWLWRLMGEPMYRPGIVRSETNLRGPLEPPSQPSDDSYWQVENDIRLFYTTHGDGRPLLFVHGGPGYPIHEPVPGLAALRNHRVFYYHQRGCGKSTRPFDKFTSPNYYANMKQLEQTLGIGAQLADIERIRRILRQDRLTLVGHSFGAFLAALYAAEFPGHVEALVLIAPAGVLVLPDEDGLLQRMAQRLQPDKQAEYRRFLEEYFNFGSIFSRSENELAAMNRKLGEFFLAAAGEAGGPGVPADNGGWMVQAQYFSMGKRHDYRAALKGVTAPTLIVHNAAHLAPESASRMYADCLPNSRLHVLKTKRAHSHFSFGETPEEFAALVEGFLTEAR